MKIYIIPFSLSLSIVALILFKTCLTSSPECPGAWQVLHQRNSNPPNFLYRDGIGSLKGGYTNAADAIAAMKEHRQYYRHPPKPEKQPERPPLFEVVK